MQNVCFGAEPSAEDLAALGSRERWLVYRDLVRHRLRHVVGVALSRTKEVIGAEAFDRGVDEWLSSGGPATRYFRHVPRDFHTHASSTWRGAEPGWLAALSEYEITCWDVRYAPSYPGGVDEFAFDRVPILNPALSVLRLSHPVHLGPTPSEGYDQGDTVVCVYRNREHKPVPWTLNAIAADLVEAWAQGDATVTETVQRVAATHGVEIGPAFVEKLSAMIADFLTRGILLGGRAQ
ncbi:MAG: putative DNA-binding domain-containing protein [Polyangiales bacterium]